MVHRFTKAYECILLAVLASGPLVGVIYLHRFQQPSLRLEHHGIHEIAIGIAVLFGVLTACVTWRCYLSSGESFLYWLALGFLGFALIYLPHGILTRWADRNIWFFLLYGPASRLVMGALFFKGLLVYRKSPEPVHTRKGPKALLFWCAIFLVIDVIVGVIAWSSFAGHPLVRMSWEGGALCLMLVGILLLLYHRFRSPLMTVYGIALALFAQSSISFFFGRPWDHQWWFAHLLFAGGFFVLSFGIIKAFHSTKSFSAIYSQEELMDQLRQAKSDLETALNQTRHANEKLERLAAIDSLTGAANRRHFRERYREEISRVNRHSSPLSLLAMDLDNFKHVNDRYGHPAGDKVLQTFAKAVRNELRPTDTLGRIGGEEFIVLLPGVALDPAIGVAERLRRKVEHLQVPTGNDTIRFTVSIGVAEFGRDSDREEKLLEIADARLYQAKKKGRNRIEGEVPPAVSS